ncbi:MAG: Trm112 family protein [Deltaproteobacteria bacterium]|nr:Trm112 family protein [Deltaproteobacteria bacterium]MBN2670464.1 Trm112 family protein [Deltaproteobacteria bacterium]
MPVNNSLIEVLACPKCKGKLEQTVSPEGFGCRTCALLYKTEDDIPNFLIEEALPWSTEPQ